MRNIANMQTALGNNTQIEVVAHGAGIGLLIASKTTQQAKIAELAAMGTENYLVYTPLEIEEGETLLPLHVAHLSKDSAKEMLETIKTGVHPLIAHTREAAISITKFYTNV